MTLDELAAEYDAQYRVLCAKMDALQPLLWVYRGKELYLLRRRLRVLYDMACECRRTAALLRGYYSEE